MKNKSMLLVLFLILSLAIFMLASCSALSETASACTSHTDSDRNRMCDTCGVTMPYTCQKHADKNHDGICDYSGCNADTAFSHADLDHDGYCDEPACKSRLEVVHSDENADGVCDVCDEILFTPPPEEPQVPDEPDTPLPPQPCESCTDGDKDYKCDVCGGEIEKEKLTLISAGVAKFNVVISSEYVSDGNTVYAVDQFLSALKSKGVKVEDWKRGGEDATDCEILIGCVEGRDSKYHSDPHELGNTGYSIRMIEGKIVVIAGSKETMPKAIAALRAAIEESAGGTSIRELTVSDYDDIIMARDDYKVSTIKLLGSDIRGYSIKCEPSGPAYKSARALQDTLYSKTGYWLDIVTDGSCSGGVIEIALIENSGGEGFYAEFSEGRMYFASEYKTVIETEIIRFFTQKLSLSVETMEILPSDSYVKNVRDVYYNDFGAVGDGETDDLLAIIAAHEYANAGGHVVYATPGCTYYIGDNNGKNHFAGAIIQTDTVWTGAEFIIDDSRVSKDAKGGGAYARQCEIFSVRPSVSSKSVSAANIKVTSLERTATNIGYAPGYTAVVHIKNSNQKNYIRYGPNANSGADEQEVVLVDKDGNIDPSTPLMWDYETITGYTVYYAEDKPITVQGGRFTTIYNQEENVYESYSRGIWVRRSNVTVKDIEHINVGEGDTGCPSGGFTIFRGCANVLFENIVYDNMKSFYQDIDGDLVVMGSYEIAGQQSVNIEWRNCSQFDFWRDEEKKYAASGGIMGTSYNKNLTLIGCTLSSFDAHAGVWNVTIKDSEFEHINCIGGGVAYIENTRIHTMYQKNVINLRSDYGSLWMGDFYFINCTLVTENTYEVALFDATWTNHDFGFDYGTCMPTNVYVENITIESNADLIVLKLVEEGVNYSYEETKRAICKYPVWEDTVNGEENINPYGIAKQWVIKDTNGYIYQMPPLFTTEIVVERN